MHDSHQIIKRLDTIKFLSKMAVSGRKLLLVTLLFIRRKRRYRDRAKRKYWIRPLYRKRLEKGEFNLYNELRTDDREYFFRYFRMNPERFDHMHSLVYERIHKKDTNFRKAIPTRERLAITLRFLATGDAQQSLSYSFRVGKATISNIITETCIAIYKALQSTYLSTPETPKQWEEISETFEEMWDFPNVIGALDGKHIRIECPKKSGTLYYDYKGFYSIVLLALCDANYNFTLFDIGQYGSNNDCGILNQSEMGNLLENERLNLLNERIVPGCSMQPLPYFILGDEIFPLKSYLMRPFPGRGATEIQKIYNYRHSRARRTIENTFGIMVARWRILLTTIRSTVDNAIRYVLACMALHNYLRQTSTASYCPTGFADCEDGNFKPGEWRSSVENTCFDRPSAIRGRRNATEPLKMRDALTGYMVSEEGQVHWQLDYIRRTSAE